MSDLCNPESHWLFQDELHVDAGPCRRDGDHQSDDWPKKGVFIDGRCLAVLSLRNPADKIRRHIGTDQTNAESGEGQPCVDIALRYEKEVVEDGSDG